MKICSNSVSLLKLDCSTKNTPKEHNIYNNDVHADFKLQRSDIYCLKMCRSSGAFVYRHELCYKYCTPPELLSLEINFAINIALLRSFRIKKKFIAYCKTASIFVSDLLVEINCLIKMLRRSIIFIAIMYTQISSSSGAIYILFKNVPLLWSFLCMEMNCAINIALLRSF
jgi:hypothetical protein